MITTEEIIKIRNLNRRRKIIQHFMLIPLFIFVDVGWYYPLVGIFIPIFFIFMLLLSFYKGRVSCGWFCPRGSLFETIVKKISLNYPRPPIFSQAKYRQYFFIIFCCLFLFLYFATVFEENELVYTGKFFVCYYVSITLLGILLGILFGARTYCLICPAGTIQSWFARDKIVLEVGEDCINCRRCEDVCGLSLIKRERELIEIGKRIIKNKDCLKCYECLDKCPKHVLRFK